MKEGLNLLPSVAKFQAAKIKLKKKINLGMAVFLSLWVVLMVIIFGWSAFNNYLLTKAKKENTAALNQYKTLVTNVVLSKRNKYQAKLVGKVLNERFEYGSSIEKIMNIFSEEIIISGFEIGNKKQFIIKGFTADGININQVEEKLKNINLGLVTGFRSAVLNSIDVDGEGWIFQMEVNLI